MSLVRMHNVTMRYDDQLVLRGLHFRLGLGERIALIGKNGSGKTTVLKLILGLEEPSEGSIDITEGTTIGYFSQFSELDDESTVVQVLDELFAGIQAIETELDDIEHALAASPGDRELERLLSRQSHLFDEMDRRQGWTYANRIDTVLTRLGFSDTHRALPIRGLSGGWRNRAALAKILLEEPDVLLLDEPTNFLDLEGLAWLETWLHKLKGALLVVSHDRDFIDHVVQRIVEIENYHLQIYEGGFAQYVQRKRLRTKALERQFVHEEELLAYEAEAIADRQEAERNPSRTLKRRLANVKKSVTPRPVDRIITRLYDNMRLPSLFCRAERLEKRYGPHTIFHDLTFELQKGDRVAVVGPNACGKTTLIRALVGDEILDAGQVTWRRGVEYVFFNEVFEQLDLRDTVSHAVNVVGMAYRAPRRQVDQFLSLLQFADTDLRQAIGTLSGGQKARVALAKCLVSGAGVILLDEPTNHLDLTTTQVIERALIHFPGAVVFASHDRFFIDKVANRLLVFEGPGELRAISGNWTTYRLSATRAEALTG